MLTGVSATKGKSNYGNPGEGEGEERRWQKVNGGESGIVPGPRELWVWVGRKRDARAEAAVSHVAVPT